ncbi:MAG: metal ABC transporter permease [Candidatus Paraimprobicoccus trichonymphae]|uniref:Metal ABC transporter permease n=1 Tax=Candidatus Paraimprobicoccus trichonymphae TaxID=3033793 RepID=A0AA48I404_9FIRM|nr:MAG: metal ABC transporter permease [Candidatus Paraimprobicoccus trichonymphae]
MLENFFFGLTGFIFMKNALSAMILITPLFGIVSTMIVNNKLSFFSDALGHSALAGIAIGVLLGIGNNMVSIIIFSVFFALLISHVINSEISSSDTIISIFSSVGMSIGIILLSAKGNFSKYSSYLIGDILSITRSEIKILFLVLILVIFLWLIFFNKLVISSLNSELAVSKQINAKFYKNVFSILIALVVAVSLKSVGMLVINSLLIFPAASAKNIAENTFSYHIFSISFSILSGIIGIIVSFYLGISTGATIALISSCIFFITFIFSRK